jgi:hypothetical protein
VVGFLSAAALAVAPMVLTACTAKPPAPPPAGSPAVPEPSHAPAMAGGSSVELAAMTMPRATHTATALADGRVLVAGGCTTDGCGGTPDGGVTEFYEPGQRRFVPGPRMVQARMGHTATLLHDGRVLYAGGYPDEGRPPLATVEVFDPAEDRFIGVGAMATARGWHTATPLRDGRVLIVGGVDSSRALSAVEVFDPATNRVTAVAPLPGPRATHAAGVLADGRVLVAGGQTVPGHGRGIIGTAVVYDPDGDRWTPVGALQVARYKAAFAPLPDGGALVVGGQTADDAAARLATTERYDPSQATFQAGPTMSEPRYKISDAVAVLRDGRIVVAGGFGVDVLAGGQVTRIGPANPVERQFPTATELADGTVLVTGGYSERTQVTATALLVRP